MDIRAKVTIYGLTLGPLGAVVGNVCGWVWAILPWLSLAITILAAVLIESDTYRPRLRRLFAPGRAGSLYRRALIRVARWPRDWRMYNWALRFAVIYPIGIPLVLWIYPGWRAALGGIEFIAAPGATWQRIVMFCAIATYIFSLTKLASAVPKIFWKFWGRLIAGAGSLVLAVAVAAAFSSLGTFVLALAVALGVALGATAAGAFAGVLPVALAFGFAFAVAGVGEVGSASLVPIAGAIIVDRYSEKGFGRAAYFLYTVLLLSGLFATLPIANWADSQTGNRVTFLFVGILPLLNAIFDYASYALTWTLLRAGVLRPRRAVVLGIFDLAAACGLFLISGAGMVIAVAGANTLSGVELYPLADLFHGIRDTPTDYLWLYVMLFSTLLPTVLHAGVGMFSLGALLPKAFRRTLQGMITDKDALAATAAPLLIGLYWTTCLLIPCLIAYAFYQLIAHWYPYPLAWYLNWLEHIACWMGPASCPL
ncbi:hypothetical protein [Puniceibacterium sediminis]|uniref:Uncharacterized protein n=1 Tax=Puniceibacterium sediminis TaxID=1608407 RepID=A0A238YIZ2_9RHOB|nr:hypothetical protein [Puniceibacterium sediminis]SNR70691.1 hypothetical protein SAMN06265370_11743 [Puniceibacterium sediminis]